MRCTAASRLVARSVAVVLLGLFTMVSVAASYSGGELADPSRGPGADLSDFYAVVPWYKTPRFKDHKVTKLILRYWDARGDYGKHHDRKNRRAEQKLRQAPGVLAFISQAYDATHIFEWRARFDLTILVVDLRMQESLPLLLAFASKPALDPGRYDKYGPAAEDLLRQEKNYDERKVCQAVLGITQLAEDGSQAAQAALLQFVNHDYEWVRIVAVQGYFNLCDGCERHVLDLYDVVSQENRWILDRHCENDEISKPDRYREKWCKKLRIRLFGADPPVRE